MNKQQVLEAFVLAIAGYDFELGADLLDKTEKNLQAALVFCKQLMLDSNPHVRQQYCTI